MKNIPYIIDHRAEFKRLKQANITTALNKLSNLFKYNEDQIISTSGLIELGKLYKVSSSDLKDTIRNTNTEEDLFRLAKIIANMNKFKMIVDKHNVNWIINNRLENIYREKYG